MTHFDFCGGTFDGVFSATFSITKPKSDRLVPVALPCVPRGRFAGIGKTHRSGNENAPLKAECSRRDADCDDRDGRGPREREFAVTTFVNVP